uniref:Secreted protein n=1 Tax=Opuntia streptacantha TaxID=393608 RepID=A0A7C8YAC4_OPUST
MCPCWMMTRSLFFLISPSLLPRCPSFFYRRSRVYTTGFSSLLGLASFRVRNSGESWAISERVWSKDRNQPALSDHFLGLTRSLASNLCKRCPFCANIPMPESIQPHKT